MKERKVTRYMAECGRGFWSKTACLHHDEVCQCWKNPKHKTCLTCANLSKFTDVTEGNGCSESFTVRECMNPLVDESLLTPCHENAPDIYKNCPYWVLKQKK